MRPLRFPLAYRLLPLLIAVGAPAQAEWQRAESAHFTIYADAKPAWVRDYALDLERFDMLARYLFGLEGRDVGMKLTIYVLDTSGDVRSAYGDNAGNVGGFYVAAAGGAMAVVPRATGGIQSSDIVLRHEYAHHLMMQYFPAAYPLWYVEGFADFLSTARFDGHDFADLGTPPPARWLAATRGNRLGIAKLLDAQPDRLNDFQRGALYAEGWLLTHYLTVSGERKGQIENYLALINAGRPQAETATTAFGPLDRLQADFDRYRKQSRLNYFHLAKPFVYADSVTVAALDAAGQDTIRERLALARGVPAEQRLALAVALERAAARYPESAETLAMLAQARLALDDYDAADAAADKAMALDPKLARAALWRGLADTGRLRKAGNHDATAWKAARAFIVRANRAAPDDALPLYENYRIYRWLGMAPSQTAQDGLARAWQLLPQHVGIRIDYARLLAKTGKRDAAIVLLMPLANAPHRSEAAEAATRMIVAIRAGQVPEDAPMADGGEE